MLGSLITHKMMLREEASKKKKGVAFNKEKLKRVEGYEMIQLENLALQQQNCKCKKKRMNQ